MASATSIATQIHRPTVDITRARRA
jgi:hypothetical protein